MARTPGAGSWADKAASPVPHRPKARPPVSPVPAGLLPSTNSCVASTLPPQSGEGAWRYLGGIGVWAGRGFKPQLILLRPCGMVGAGRAVCTTVFHSGPLAQAGRPPKPSPWASRLGRGRGPWWGDGKGEADRERRRRQKESQEAGERERERTERERREGRREATTVGKTRKWQEMGVVNRALTVSPTAPLAVPTALLAQPPPHFHTPCLAPRQGHSEAGRPCQRKQKDLRQVKERRAKLGAGRLCPGQGRSKLLSTWEAPHSPTLGSPKSGGQVGAHLRETHSWAGRAANSWDIISSPNVSLS